MASEQHLLPSADSLVYGVDYYPEQWPESRWATDAGLMREVGLQVVRLAEFAWGLFEPEEGHFEWGWLDRALDVLGNAGLRFILCTPTPTPPAWLTERYPDTCRVDPNGVRMSPQTRRHACANAPDYRRLAMRIAREIATRYGNDPRVVGWQTDNEYGCHDTIRCICEHCTAAFQGWLARRYGSLDALNDAWGTNFWSQRYTDWSQILPPRPAPADHNPALVLDFDRFSSDTWVEFNREQVALLRQYAPNHLVTHNLMIYFFDFDHYALGRDLDVVSWDNYHHHGAQPVTVAANHDIMWGAKERNFWVIEQQVGQVNWSVYNPLFAPGELSLKVMQAIAHGADGILFFRWRQARFGAEMYHSGLLDHAARPTRAFDEAQAIGQLWERLAGALAGTVPTHGAAIIHDFDSHWALEYQPHSRSLNPRAPSDEPLLYAGDAPLQPMNRRGLYLLPVYEALWRHNIQAAIIGPAGNLDRYRVIFAPQLHIATEAQAERFRRWVEAGGTLIFGPRTGFKNEANALHDQPQPGPLTALIGGEVREFDTRTPGATLGLRLGEQTLPVGVWCEMWEPAPGTEVLAYYDDSVSYADQGAGGASHLAGKPAILRRHHGAGQVITLGTLGGWPLIEALLPLLKLEAPLATPFNVEAVQRGDLLFLLNHNTSSRLVDLPGNWEDVSTGAEATGEFELPAYGWRIFQRTQPAHGEEQRSAGG